MGMVFLEMAYLQVYAHSRFISVPCLLLPQFKKTFTPQILKVQGEKGQNREKIASDSIHPSKTTPTDTELFFSALCGLLFTLQACFGTRK